jgi:hypothetical protein
MTSFDVVTLAKRINQRREEWNRLHPDRPVRVSSAMSRILENDPDYLPYRERRAGKRQRPVLNPTVSTLVQIASALGTTVGDLLGEPMPLSPAEEKMLRDFIRMAERLRAQRGGTPPP